MKNQNWFVRRGKEISGPFPAGLISRYVLLGRIRLLDQVSQDRRSWLLVGQVPELIPEVMLEAARNPDDQEAQQQLEAARRWADERINAERAGDERRHEEDAHTLSHRQSAAQRRRNGRRGRTPLEYALVLAVIVLVIAVPLMLPQPEETGDPQCDAPPAPAVNWTGCRLAKRDLANVDLAGASLREADLSGSVLRAANLERADLSYAKLAESVLRGANLAGSTLVGADLRGADLAHASLRGADLSYADLNGAVLEAVDFTDARLGNAIWEPGVICMPESVGKCVPARSTAD